MAMGEKMSMSKTLDQLINNISGNLTRVADHTITPEKMIEMIFNCIEITTKGPSVVQLTDVDPHMKMIVAEWQKRNKKE